MSLRPAEGRSPIAGRPRLGRRRRPVVLLALTLVGAAWAHAYLDTATPASFGVAEPGAVVVLRFTSELEPAFSRFELRRLTLPDGAWPADPAATTDIERMRLTALAAQQLAAADPDGAVSVAVAPDRRTSEVTLTPGAPLEPGAYAVRFEVLAIDGHTTTGQVVFFVVGD